MKYSSYNSKDSWAIENDFEKEVKLKMTTSADIIHALEEEGTIDEEEIIFEDDTPKDFKILKRTDSNSGEEIEVSFTYNSKIAKFKLVFGKLWVSYKCLSMEQIE